MRLLNKTTTKTSHTLGKLIVIATTALFSMTMMNVAVADVATTYNDSCAACHNSGALGAIKKGNSTAWNSLIEQKGMPALVKSVKGGMIQMPAGGLCDNCSDEDYRKLINYMSK